MNWRSSLIAVLLSVLILALVIILLTWPKHPRDRNGRRAEAPPPGCLDNAERTRTEPAVSEVPTSADAVSTAIDSDAPEGAEEPVEKLSDLNDPELAQLLKDLEAPPGDRRDYLIAVFDVNDDSQPDVIVFEKKELQVSQILLGEGKGRFTEPTEEIKVPEYVRRFLTLAAEEGPTEGAVLIRTEDGTERQIFLLGEDD